MNEFTSTVDQEKANLELATQAQALSAQLRVARLSVAMDVPDTADTTFKQDMNIYFETVTEVALSAQTNLLAKLKADKDTKQRSINATKEVIANLKAIQMAMPAIKHRMAAIDNIQGSSGDSIVVAEESKTTTALEQLEETIAALEEKVSLTQAALDEEVLAIAQLNISKDSSKPAEAVAEYQQVKRQAETITVKLKLIDSKSEQGKYRAVCEDLSLLAGRMQQLVGSEGSAPAISANRSAAENLAEVERWVKSAEDTYVQQALQDAGILAHESKYSSQLQAAKSKQPEMINADISQFTDSQLQKSIELAIAAHKAWQLVHKTQEAIIHLRQQGNFAPNAEVGHNKQEVDENTTLATQALQVLKREFQARKSKWTTLTAENADDTDKFSKRIALLKLEARLLQRLGESSDTIVDQMQALKDSYLSAVQQRVTQLTTHVAELVPQVPAEIEDTLQAKAQKIKELNENSRQVLTALVELRLLAKAFGTKAETASSDGYSTDGELADSDIKFATSERLILEALATLQARARILFSTFDISAKQETASVVLAEDKVTKAKAMLSDWVSSLAPAKVGSFESIDEASAAIREYTHAALTSSSSAAMREILATTGEFEDARVVSIQERYELAQTGLAQAEAFAEQRLAQQASILAEVQSLLSDARLHTSQELFSEHGEHSLVQALAKLEAVTAILDEQQQLHDARTVMSETLAAPTSHMQALDAHDGKVLEAIGSGRQTVARQTQAILALASHQFTDQHRTRLDNHARFVAAYNQVNVHSEEIKEATRAAVASLAATVPAVATQGVVVNEMQEQFAVSLDTEDKQDELAQVAAEIEEGLTQAKRIDEISQVCITVGEAIQKMQAESTAEVESLHQHQAQTFVAEHKIVTELAVMAQAAYLSDLAHQTHAEVDGNKDLLAQATAIARMEGTEAGKLLALQTYVTTVVALATAQGDGELLAASVRPQHLNNIATQIDRDLPLTPAVKSLLLDIVATEQQNIGSLTAAIATRARAEAYHQATVAIREYQEALARFAILKQSLQENPMMQPLLAGFEQEVTSLHLQDPNNVMRMTGLTMALTALCDLHEERITIEQFSAIVAELDGHADAGVRNLGKGLLLVGAGAALTLALAGTGIGATVAAAVALYGLAKWLRGQEHGVAFLTRKIAMQQQETGLSAFDERKALLADWLDLTTAKAKALGNQATGYSSEQTQLLGEKAEAVTVLAMTAVGNKYAAARIVAEPRLTSMAQTLAEVKHSTGEKWQTFTTNVSHRWTTCRDSVQQVQWREIPGRMGESMADAASRARDINLRPDFAALGESLRDRTTRAGESLNAGWQRTCHAMGDLSQEMADKFNRMNFRLFSGNRVLVAQEMYDGAELDSQLSTEDRQERPSEILGM